MWRVPVYSNYVPVHCVFRTLIQGGGARAGLRGRGRGERGRYQAGPGPTSVSLSPLLARSASCMAALTSATSTSRHRITAALVASLFTPCSISSVSTAVLHFAHCLLIVYQCTRVRPYTTSGNVFP